MDAPRPHQQLPLRPEELRLRCALVPRGSPHGRQQRHPAVLGTGEAGQQRSRQALCAQIALQLVEPDHAVREPQERQVDPRQATRALRDQEQPFREAPMKGFEGAARLASRGRADQDHESAVAEGMVQLGVTGPPHVRRRIAGIGCAIHLTRMHPETMWIGDVTDSGAAASAQGAERVPHQPCGLSPAAEHQERGSRAWCHSLATRRMGP